MACMIAAARESSGKIKQVGGGLHHFSTVLNLQHASIGIRAESFAADHQKHETEETVCVRPWFFIRSFPSSEEDLHRSFMIFNERWY
jgi:hypothetical protein